jgi:hypothetical protein
MKILVAALAIFCILALFLWLYVLALQLAEHQPQHSDLTQANTIAYNKQPIGLIVSHGWLQQSDNEETQQTSPLIETEASQYIVIQRDVPSISYIIKIYRTRSGRGKRHRRHYPQQRAIRNTETQPPQRQTMSPRKRRKLRRELAPTYL